MRSRVLVLLALAFAPLSLEAQRARPGPQRQLLEERFRNRLRDVMQRRLELSDSQVDRLGEVNQRFESRRRELLVEEREVRLAMRRQLAPNGPADQGVVEQLLDRAWRVQRQRLDLNEAEQRELTQFLTPVQRARYFGLQEQLRRQIEEIRERPGIPRRAGARPPRF